MITRIRLKRISPYDGSVKSLVFYEETKEEQMFRLILLDKLLKRLLPGDIFWEILFKLNSYGRKFSIFSPWFFNRNFGLIFEVDVVENIPVGAKKLRTIFGSSPAHSFWYVLFSRNDPGGLKEPLLYGDSRNLAQEFGTAHFRRAEAGFVFLLPIVTTLETL